MIYSFGDKINAAVKPLMFLLVISA
jgi:hypothetical protein